MLIYEYNGTFEGMLSCIFECYSSRQFPDKINIAGKEPMDLFQLVHTIQSDALKATRVWKKIQQLMSAQNNQLLYYAFLSEEKDIEMSIMHFCRRLFKNEKYIESDFGDPDVLKIVQAARKVKKEAAGMKQFVRFQQ